MTQHKRVLIASDHAGLHLKTEIQKQTPEWEWIDLGPQDSNKVDYPDLAEKLAKQLLSGKATQGVLICGSGIGMSIAANKIPGIRAALVENPSSARLAKEHNHANVLCLGSRFIAPEYGAEIIKSWLEASSDQDSRHLERIKKIHKLERLD